MQRNKLYSIVLIACFAGYIWLYFNSAKNIAEIQSADVCLVKYVTGVPCPSCGATRSVMSLTKGDFQSALLLNPLGYPVAIIMLFAPMWISVDWISKRHTFFIFYKRTEEFLRKPMYAIPLILLVIVNWIWNIAKGL